MYDLSNFYITHLFLNRAFEGKFTKLPKSLKVLRFDSFSFFNNSLSCLPPNLEYLELGYTYNKKLDLKHLTKLHTLILGPAYHHSLDNTLPSSLKHLEIHASEYTHNINNLLSKLPNLEVLEFGLRSHFNQDIDLLYNNNIRKITFGGESSFNSKILNAPSSLKYLKIAGNFKDETYDFPLSITELTIEERGNLNIDKLNLPNLKKLYVHSDKNENDSDTDSDSDANSNTDSYSENEHFIYSYVPYIGDIYGNKIAEYIEDNEDIEDNEY